MGTVYQLTFPNGKIYIGKTNNSIEKRLHQHWLHYKKGYPCGQAVRYYGIENVITTSLFELDDDQLIDIVEMEFIDHFDTRNRKIGYNLAPGGDGGDLFNSLPLKQQTRLKEMARERHLIRLEDPEYRKSLSRPKELNPMFGKTHTPEVRKRLSEVNTGRKPNWSEEVSTRRSKLISDANRARSQYTPDEWKSIKHEMINGLSIKKAMQKFNLKQSTTEALSKGTHWSCRTP